MLPDQLPQQLGWGPQPGAMPVDPTLAGQPSSMPLPDWLHPAVIQGLGASAPGAPPADQAAPFAASGPELPAAPPGTPAPPMPADLPQIGGPGAQLPSSPTPAAPSAPEPGRDFVSPASGAVAPAKATATQAPAKPMTVEQSMAANQAKLGQATQEEKSAVEAQTQAKIGEASDALTAQQVYAEKEKDLQRQAAVQRDQAAQAQALAHKTVTDRMKALDDYKIDANKYWNDMGTGGKIGMFVAMALSGIGNALAGKGDAPNPVIQMLQQKMHQSILLQQDKRDQMSKGIERAQGEEQNVALVQAKRAADISAAQADATKMLKIQVDLATAKAADPIARANGQKESAMLDRQLAIDTGNAIDKSAAYNIQKQQLGIAQQQVGIAGGHLALDRKKFELDVAWKSWEQNRDQQKLDLQAAKESLAERKQIGEKDVQLGVTAPVSDGKGGFTDGMLTQKDGTIWHAKPEEAPKTQAMVAAAVTYNRLAGKMINGIAQHGGESSWLKGKEFQDMKTDMEAAVVELHDAYGINAFREPTVKFFEQMVSAGVDPTSFVRDATAALKNSSENLQERVNTKLHTANYTGAPISFAPLAAPEATSPEDKMMAGLKTNGPSGMVPGMLDAQLRAMGKSSEADKLSTVSSKLATISTLGQQLEARGPQSAQAAQLLGAIATSKEVAPRIRDAALEALNAANEKRAAGSYAAGDKTYPAVHPESAPGKALEAQSHIPGIIQRINQGAGPPTLPGP